MNELDSAIFSKLSAGTALISSLGGTAIFHLEAPKDYPYPYVIYSWQAGGPITEVAEVTSVVEFVRAYANNAAQAGTIDALCSTLLNNQTLSVTGWTNVHLMREQDFESVETPINEQPIFAVGGLYRIMLDK
jgi:hypothetical protein